MELSNQATRKRTKSRFHYRKSQHIQRLKSVPENQSLSSHSDSDVPPDPNSEGRSDAGTVSGDSSASVSSGSRHGVRVRPITYEAEMAQLRTQMAQLLTAETAQLRTHNAQLLTELAVMRTELAKKDELLMELAEMRTELAKKDDTIIKLKDDLLTKSSSACFSR